MRIVKLATDDVEQTVQVDGNVTRLTGTDEQTGERVKFKLSDPGFANTLTGLVRRDGSAAIPVADFQVIAVEPGPEPVSGEWDSPGTSPEYMDDEEF